jgi:Flp pilus assembly protein TadB
MILIEKLLIIAFFINSIFLFSTAIPLIQSYIKWTHFFLENQQAQKKLEKNLPLLLLQFSSFLKSGHAITQALKHLAKSKQGRLLCQSLSTENNRSSPLTFLKTCIKLSQKNGMALSPLLQTLSHLHAEQLRFQDKQALLTFPLRAQALIAMILPWAVIFIFYLQDPSLILNALQNSRGGVGFTTALALESGAFLWIRQILKTS